MTESIWGGIRVEVWPTDTSKDRDIEDYGEHAEEAINRARFLSKNVRCISTHVITGSSLELARFAGRWALDNPEGI